MPAPRTLALLTALALAGLGALGAAPTAASPAKGVAVAAAPKPSGPKCGGERPKRPEGGRYECSFEDDFAGTSLDTSKWLVQETSFSGMTTANRDCYVNSGNNIAVSDGVIRLTSRVEPEPFTCRSPFGDFTTTTTAATVVTSGRFAQAYGRFEFRAKMPPTTAHGLHSALWLYPQRLTYGAWPHSGEIDVAEWFSGDSGKVYPSVHYQGEDPWQSTGFNCQVASAGNEYHRYAVEWTPNAMRFLYDGATCFEHRWTPDAPLVAPEPFDQPFYVVLTQIFGGAWNAVTADTPSSGTMTVDWVRVWR